MDYSDFARVISIRFPVTGMLVYRGDVAVIKRGESSMASITRGDRKKITMLSKKARTRLAFIALATPIEFHSMMTLTYGPTVPLDGEIVKHNLWTFLRQLRIKYDCDYLWVIEFQRRGAPHFHLITTVQNISQIDRVWMAATWLQCLGYGDLPFRDNGLDDDEIEEGQKIWRVHTHKSAWENIREKDGGVHYMVKYATKTYQKTVPTAYQNVGRFWGCSYNVSRDIAPMHEFTADETTIRDTLESIGNGAWDSAILPKVVWAVRW